MKITETVSRDCCQSKDLKLVEGSKLRFCIHCGARHELSRDAEGDRVYQKMTGEALPDPMLTAFIQNIASHKLCAEDDPNCRRMSNGHCMTHDYPLGPIVTAARMFVKS